MDEMERATLDAIMSIRQENKVEEKTQKNTDASMKTASISLTDISKSFKDIDKLPSFSMPKDIIKNEIAPFTSVNIKETLNDSKDKESKSDKKRNELLSKLVDIFKNDKNPTVPSIHNITNTPNIFNELNASNAPDNFITPNEPVTPIVLQNGDDESVSAWSAFKTGAIKFWETDSIKHLSGGFNKVISSVQSELSTILGPLQGIISSAWDMAKNIGGFFTSAFSDVKNLFGFGGYDCGDE